MRLERWFYVRDGRTVARELLGKVLVRRTGSGFLRGIIVETEAYLGPEDRASHAWGGRPTPRTESMYLTGGHAYVYLIYGLHHCFNIVAMGEGIPHAVLIRAVEPCGGREIMEERRGRRGYEVANGPGKVCQAMDIGREEDAIDLTTSPELWVEEGEDTHIKVVSGKRIGIEYAGEYRDKPWRYYIEGNPWVSRKKRI